MTDRAGGAAALKVVTGETSAADAVAPVPQHLRALERANALRLRRAALKRAVLAGTLPMTDALLDEAVLTATLADVLAWQRRWSLTRAERLLDELGIGPAKTVGWLTVRQLEVLRDALDQR